MEAHQRVSFPFVRRECIYTGFPTIFTSTREAVQSVRRTKLVGIDFDQRKVE